MIGRHPHPQQLLLSDMLAAGHPRNAVLLPRRSSKTTSLIAIGLGRAEARDDYRVAIMTMTTGKAGRSRFLKDVVPMLERSGVPRKVVRAAGQERVEFPTGGTVSWLSTMDDLRGEAFDLIILDESGEPDPQKVEDTLAAALPTLDTRPGAQIVVAGTAGRYRIGNLLWEWLELGRRGRAGILEYSMPETVQDEDFELWETVAPLITAAHPGIGTLTTLDAVRGNWETMPRRVFAAEYGGLFGDEGGTVTLFDMQKWGRTGVDGTLPALPDRFGLAFAAHPDQLSVSIVAAWRDERGRAVLLQLDRLTGIDKAPAVLTRAWRKYRAEITYDAGSQVNALIVERLQQQQQTPKLAPIAFLEVKKAASLIVDEADRENIVHYTAQLELDEAFRLTMKRRSGDRGWLLGRDPKRPNDDITIAEAAAAALLHYDTSRPKLRARARVSA